MMLFAPGLATDGFFFSRRTVLPLWALVGGGTGTSSGFRAPSLALFRPEDPKTARLPHHFE